MSIRLDGQGIPFPVKTTACLTQNWLSSLFSPFSLPEGFGTEIDLTSALLKTGKMLNRVWAG